MSNEILNRVWNDESITLSRNRLILICLADQASNFGICWPGLNDISERTCCSKPTVIRGIRELEQLGAIEVFERHRQSHHYIVKIGMTNKQLAFARKAVMQLKGIDEARKPVEGSLSKDGFTLNLESTRLYPSGKPVFTQVVNPSLPQPKGTINDPSIGLSDVFSHYQNKIGQLTPMLSSDIQTASQQHPFQWLIEAIDIASEKGKRSWSYINGILNNWSSNGKQDSPPSSNGNHSLPDNLNTIVFRIAWEKWKQHMKEKGRSLTPTSTEASLQELSEWGEDRATEAINFSVRKGWLSINEDEKRPPEQSDQPYLGYSPLGK